ncbi:MAG TPA: hypothetical protein VN673_00425 [Clostridia bacterium]|nr:hypothetical protein [Clostridia bacterium]
MTPSEAKQVLLLYRPGRNDEEDPEIRSALALTRTDPELALWFEQHCAFQNAMRAKLRSVPAPVDLKAAILGQSRIVRPAFWQRPPAWLAAAAALVLLAGVATVLLRPGLPDRFVHFQNRMVGTALREYRMDIVTNDMSQVRTFLASRGAPGDYEVTPGLERLKLTGGGVLRWRNHPVSMVCFNRGDEQMLFLFVMDRSAVKDAPPETPEVTTTHELATVSWSKGDKTYVLAGPEESNFLKKYL